MKTHNESDDLADIAVMGAKLINNLSPEDIRAWFALHPDEKGLSRAFAAASNKFWWVEDNIYDYDEGTPEYNEACMITNAWGDLMNELEDKILDILRAENVKIPEKGRIVVLVPFMERNGYYDADGWWVPIKNG